MIYNNSKVYIVNPKFPNISTLHTGWNLLSGIKAIAFFYISTIQQRKIILRHFFDQSEQKRLHFVLLERLFPR